MCCVGLRAAQEWLLESSEFCPGKMPLEMQSTKEVAETMCGRVVEMVQWSDPIGAGGTVHAMEVARVQVHCLMRVEQG